MKAIAAIGAALLVAVIIIGLMYVTISNKEIRLRNQIKAKQTDNTSELDNVQKKISQVVQVSDLQMTALKDIIVGNAQARAQGAGSLATLVKEAVPNLDATSSTFNNIINIITGSRDAWTMRQKELLDLKREHDNLIDTFPSSLVVGGRGKIDVVIVTSGRVKENFRTGEDNDIDLKPKAK